MSAPRSLRPFVPVLGLALLAVAWTMPRAAAEIGAVERGVRTWYDEAPRAVMPEPPPVLRAPVSPGHAPAGPSAGEPAAFHAAAPRGHGRESVEERVQARAVSQPPLYDLYRVYRL